MFAAYSCKYVDRKPAFIAHDTLCLERDQTDGFPQIVETWVLRSGAKVTLWEVFYGPKQVRRFTNGRDNALKRGPELYRVCVDGRLHASIWHPLYVPQYVSFDVVPTNACRLVRVKPGTNSALYEELIASVWRRWGRMFLQSRKKQFYVAADVPAAR